MTSSFQTCTHPFECISTSTQVLFKYPDGVLVMVKKLGVHAVHFYLWMVGNIGEREEP